MKKSTLTSTVTIASIAALAISTVASNMSHAADLTWDWTKAAATSPANTWNTSLESWTSSSTFSDGDNVIFDVGGTTKTVTVGEALTAGNININTDATDSYTFSGASVSVADGSVLTFNLAGDLALNTQFASSNKSTVVKKTGAGTLRVGAMDAFRTMTLNLNEGNIVTTTANAFDGGVYLSMAVGTKLSLNGNDAELQQLQGANYDAGTRIIENGGATDAKLVIWNNKDDGAQLNMDGILFQDGGTGKLSVEVHYNAKTPGDQQPYVYWFRRLVNTFSGGFHSIGAKVAFSGNASGTGAGTGDIWYTTVAGVNNEMIFRSDLAAVYTVPNNLIVDGDGTLKLGIQSGATVTFTGNITNSNTSVLNFTWEGIVVFKPINGASAYAPDLWVGMPETLLTVEVQNTGVNYLPNIRMLNSQSKIRIIAAASGAILSQKIYTNVYDASYRLAPGTGGVYTILKGSFESDGGKYFNFFSTAVDGPEVKYILAGTSDGFGEGGIYQAQKINFTVGDNGAKQRKVTLQLGDNSGIGGNLNYIWGGVNDVVGINVRGGSELIFNWADNVLLNANVRDGGTGENNAGTITKKQNSTLTVARSMFTRGDVKVDAGTLIFGYATKYNPQLGTLSAFDRNNTGGFAGSAMQNYKSIQVAAGATLILDYISIEANNSVEFFNKVEGAGNLVIGGAIDTGKSNFVSLYHVDPNEGQTFSGKTTVHSQNHLTIGSNRFASTDLTIEKNALVDYDVGIISVALTSLANDGSLTLTALDVTSGTVNGIGQIAGNVSLTNSTVAVNPNGVDTLSISGDLTLNGNSLTMSASDTLDVQGILTVATANNLLLTVGKGGFTAGDKYTLIKFSSGTVAASNFNLINTGVRSGVLTVGTDVSSVFVNVGSGIGNLTWAGTVPFPNWNTTDTNWTGMDGKFYVFDNVTFDGTALNPHVIVNAGGVIAGAINVTANGYLFSGGSISGALNIADGITATFMNNSLGLNYITLGAGSNMIVDLATATSLNGIIDGTGTITVGTTNILGWNADSTDYTGDISISAGATLQLIKGLSNPTITLDGGTLVSGTTDVIASAITVKGNSIMDLGNKSTSQWLSAITMEAGSVLTLTNGTLNVTNGAAIAADSTPVGEVMLITDLELSDKAVLNRPIAPINDNSKVTVIENASFGSYGTIDLSGENGGGTNLTLDIANGKKLTNRGFLFNDNNGGGVFTKTGAGTMVFAALLTPEDRSDSRPDYDTYDIYMKYNGNIIVEEGTLEFNRGGNDDWKPPFQPYFQPTITVKGGATLFNNGSGALGRATGFTPKIIMEEGSTLKVYYRFFTENLELTGADVIGVPGDQQSTFCIDAAYNGVANAVIKVHEGVSNSVSTISTNTFSPEGNVTFDVDENAVLKMSAAFDGNNHKVDITGLGKVVWTGGTSAHANGDVTIHAGATLQAGDDVTAAATGGITNANVINNGSILYYRDGDYSVDATVSGDGTFTKYRTGKATLNKENTYTGLTTVEGGTLALGSAGKIVSDILMKSGTALDFSAYTEGYNVSQNIVLQAGANLVGKTILADSAKLYSLGTGTGSVDAGSGTTVGGTVLGTSNDSIFINSGATLVAGTMVDPISGGAYTPTIDTLQVNGSLSLFGGSTLKIDVNNTTPASGAADLVKYTGGLTLTASAGSKIILDVTNLNSASTTGFNGTYTLFEGANSYSAGDFTSMATWFKSGRATFDFTTSDATKIVMIVSDSESLSLIWNGTEGSVWNNSVETNTVWNKTSSGTSYFVNNDTVTFDATAATKAVTVAAGGVTAAAMTVKDADYTFAGGVITTTGALNIDGVKATFNNTDNNQFSSVVLANGGTLNLGANQTSLGTTVVSGTGNLEKSGTGTLDLSGTANTYTGSTIISGGIMKIDALANISGTLSDVSLNGGTLNVTAALDLSNGGARVVNIGSNGGGMDIDSGMAVTAKFGTIEGSFTKSGDGDLTVQDGFSASKTVNVDAGKLIAKDGSFAVLNGAGELDANSGSVTVQSGSFSGTISNMNKLVVKHLESSVSSTMFKYDAGITDIDTEIESGSTLESNLSLGAGKTLVAGTDEGQGVVTAIKGNLTLGSGSIVHIADNVSSGNGTVGVLKVDGSANLSGARIFTSVNFGQSIDSLSVSGQLTLDTSNANTIHFESDGSWGTATYTLATFGSISGVTQADIENAFVLEGLTRKRLNYILSGTSIKFTINSEAANWTWDNGTTNGRWDMFDPAGAGTNGSDNWDGSSSYNPPSFAAGDNAIFTNNAAGTIDVWGVVTGSGNGEVNVSDITFQNTSGNDYTFTGGKINADLIKTTANGTVNFENVINANQIILDNGAAINLKAAGNKVVETLFVKNGALTLAVNDTLTDTVVNLNGSNAKVVIASGTTNTIKQLDGTSGTVDLTGSAATTLQLEAGTYSGKITGNSNSTLEKTGSGKLTLSGLNTGAGNFDGTLAVSAGMLVLNGANTVNTFNSGAGASISLNGDLTVTDGISDGNIGGNGNLISKGSFELGGNNSFAGSLIIEAGTTKLGSATAIKQNTAIDIKSGATFDLNGNNASAASLTAAAGSTVALNNNAVLTSSSSSNTSFNGKLTGDGKLVKEGKGTLTLTDVTNDFSGGLDINGGTVSISDDRALGNSSVNINDGGKLMYTASANSSARTFTLGGTSSVEVTNVSDTLQLGALNGSGTFVKDGEGIVDLVGTNSYTGSYNVKSGTLRSVADIILNDGQILSGVGTVDANVIVNSGGKLAPGNSIGHQTITGNVDLNDGALLGFEVSSTADSSLANISNSDRLDILGDLNLNGSTTLNISKESNSVKFTQETYKFLLADVTGDFNGDLSAINIVGNHSVFTNDYRLELSLENGDLYLTMKVNRPDYYLYANSDNSQAVANYLDDGWSNANEFWKTDVASQVRSIGASDPGAVSNFLNQLSGYTLAHATQSRELASDHFRQLRSQRLTTGEASKFISNRSVRTINAEEVNTQRKFVDVDERIKDSYWAQPFSYYTNMKNESHISGYEYKSYGITGGFDSRWDTGYLGGLAFFYEDADIDVKKSSDKSDVEDARFAIFGGWESENLSVVVSGVYGIQQYDSKRSVRLGDLGGNNKASYDGTSYGASIDLSAKMNDFFSVIAGFDYENIQREKFTEHGSDFAMNVKSDNYDTYASRLGIRYDRDFGSMAVYGLVAWKHRFDSSESEVEGYYTGVAGSFTANGLSPDKDSALLGLGGEYSFNTQYSIFGDVNADLNSSRTDVGLSVGLRYIW